MHRHAVELRPLNESDDELLRSLEQQQEDVWEFIGTLPTPDAGRAHHLFAVMEGEASVGIAGLVRTQALDGRDYELLCAMRSEAQLHGFAKQACRLVLAWSFETAKLERVIACIDGQQRERARDRRDPRHVGAVRGASPQNGVREVSGRAQQRDPPGARIMK